MSESLFERISRIFPTFGVSTTHDGVKVSAHGHVCWIESAAVADLDDMEVSHLVTCLLFPEVTA